jgi:cell division protein FtsQ
MAKQKKIKKRFLLRLILLILVMGTLVAILLSLPIWRIKEVIVTGNQILSKDQILEQARIGPDEHLFLISTNGIEKRIKSLVQVKEVSISRKIPSTVIIQVKERTPFALIVFDGKAAVIDDEGVLMKTSEKSVIPDLPNLPVVRGLSSLDSQDAKAMVRSLKTLTKFLEPKKIQFELGKIGDASLLIDDVLRVRIFLDEELEHRMKILETLLENVKDKKTKIEYIDVRYPSNPVIKFKP